MWFLPMLFISLNAIAGSMPTALEIEAALEDPKITYQAMDHPRTDVPRLAPFDQIVIDGTGFLWCGQTKSSPCSHVFFLQCRDFLNHAIVRAPGRF